MRLRTGLTLVVLVGLLVAAVVVGWRLLTTNIPLLNAAQPTCSNEKLPSGSRLESSQVTVNVYNSGSISGLANATMLSLNRRGFGAGVVADAPPRIKAKNVTIFDPRPKAPSVRLVKQQFAGKVAVRKRRADISAGVDVVVGDKFAGLAPKAATSLRLRGTTRVCVDVTPTP